MVKTPKSEGFADQSSATLSRLEDMVKSIDAMTISTLYEGHQYDNKNWN